MRLSSSRSSYDALRCATCRWSQHWAADYPQTHPCCWRMSFSLFKIPIRVQPMFWVVAVVLGMGGGSGGRALLTTASWIAVLFVSILVHELGHAFAMRAFGREPSIELWGLGGLTSWGQGPKVSLGADILVSLAGPAAGLLLGGLVLAGAMVLSPAAGSMAEVVVTQALWVNIGWGLVNLLPILPLDGGHVLESGATWLGGARGRRVAHGLSLALAVGAVALAAWYRLWWIAFLAVWCVSISWRAWSTRSAGHAAPAEIPPGVDAATRAAMHSLARGEVAEAVAKCEAALTSLPESAEYDVGRDMLLEALAWAQIEAGNDAAALNAARRMKGGPSSLLAARLLVAEGKLEQGVHQLEQAFSEARNSFPALVLSSVYVDQGRPDLTAKMLQSKRGESLSAQTHLTLSAQLFHAECFEAALAVSQLAFERFGSAEHAYNAACALSRLGRVDEGLDVLTKAIQAGFEDKKQLDDDVDLAALRTHPRWAEVRALGNL